MPAFGFLLIIAGIFILVNVFNGNLVNLIMGNYQLNFGSSAISSQAAASTTNTPPTTAAGSGKSGFTNPGAGQGIGGGGGGAF